MRTACGPGVWHDEHDGDCRALASQWFVGVFADYQKAQGLSGREQWDPMFPVYVGVLLFGAIAGPTTEVSLFASSHRRRRWIGGKRIHRLASGGYENSPRTPYPQ